MEGSRAFSCAVVDGNDVWVESHKLYKARDGFKLVKLYRKIRVKNVMWKNWWNCGKWCPTFQERTQVLNLRNLLPSLSAKASHWLQSNGGLLPITEGKRMDSGFGLFFWLFFGWDFLQICKWFGETSEIEKTQWSANTEVWISSPLRLEKFVDILQLSKRWTFADNMLECGKIQASWTTTDTPSAIFWDSFATNDMSNGANFNCICPFAKQSRLQVAKMGSSLNRQTQIGRCPVCHCGIVALLDVGANSMPS